jgi:hypothetical protein
MLGQIDSLRMGCVTRVLWEVETGQAKQVRLPPELRLAAVKDVSVRFFRANVGIVARRSQCFDLDTQAKTGRQQGVALADISGL